MTTVAALTRKESVAVFDPALLAEQGRDGLFVLGPMRELVYANAEGRGLLQAAYLVELTPFGIIEAVNEAFRTPLRAVAIGALAHGRSGGLDIAMPCRPRHRLTVRPLRGVAGGELAVLTVRNLDDYLQRCAAFASDRFGLSDAERRLAEGLLRGLSPADYADACGIKISTVRSQLKALFAKVGVARQSDLVLQLGVICD